MNVPCAPKGDNDGRGRGPAGRTFGVATGVAANAGIAYIDSMARLTVRDLPDDVHSRLRVRAARAGHSMEEEARRILADAVAPDSEVSGKELQEWIDRLYGEERPTGVVDALLEERRREAERE